MAIKVGVGGAQRELSSVYAGVNGANRTLSSWQGCVSGVNRELLKPPTKYELIVQKAEFVPNTEMGGPGTPSQISWEWVSGGAWGNYSIKVSPPYSVLQGWEIDIYGAFDPSLEGKTIDFTIVAGLQVNVYLFNVTKGAISEEWQVEGIAEGGFGMFSGVLNPGQNNLLMGFRGESFSGNPSINIYMSADGQDISGGLV